MDVHALPLDPAHVSLREAERSTPSHDDHRLAFLGDLSAPDGVAVLQVGDKNSDVEVNVPLSNPFELLPALKFAALLVAIMLFARGAESWLGDQGVYIVAAIAGTNDVDAITLTLARQSLNSLAPQVAASAILMAAMVNTLVKAGLALYLAGVAARPILMVFTAAIGAGVVGLLLNGFLPGH